MKLCVRHVTRYAYDRPRPALMQSQRLTPSACRNQSVIAWDIETDGGVPGSRFRDGAGDRTWLVRVPGPVTAVTVSVSGTVETQDFAGLLKGHREKVPPQVYLRDTRATRADKAISALAREARAAADAGDGALGRAHALAAAVAEAVGYRPETTDAQTTAAEALEAGRGVCQDHAHVLIAAARSIDLPARYVAGYLYSGEVGGGQSQQQDAGSGGADAGAAFQQQQATAHGDPGDGDGDARRRAGAAATHAWAEIHVDGLGWVGFDAANSCCPDEQYIRLCSGLDADDAAPIRGLAAGGSGAETLDVSVAVTRVET